MTFISYQNIKTSYSYQDISKLFSVCIAIFLALIPGDPERKSSNNSIATAIIMTVSIE